MSSDELKPVSDKLNDLADNTTTSVPCDSVNEAGRVKLSGVQDHTDAAQIVGGKPVSDKDTISAEQFWFSYMETPEGINAYRVQSPLVFRFTFAEAYAAALRSELAAAREEIEARNAIFRWLLGEEGEFPSPPPQTGKYKRTYYWRTDLMKKLAALSESKEPA